MKIIFPALLLALSTVSAWGAGFVVDHTCTNLSQIPDEWITKAQSDLHIVYEHTSHGSQLISGMMGLATFPEFKKRYTWNDTTSGDATSLSLKDHDTLYPDDLSQGDRDDNLNNIADWADSTAKYLQEQRHEQVNVVMWSWCDIRNHNIPRYLASMEWLIAQFSAGGTAPRAALHPVQFVFITGHANGGGENDSSDAQNQLIREHCRNHERIMFDFADMENFDPDNNYFLDKHVTDALYYDKNGSHDANWAEEYLARHPGSELYRITKGENNYGGIASCAHSNGPHNDAYLNCTLKGRAAWYLFARLAGWNPKNNDSENNGESTNGGSVDHGPFAYGHKGLAPVNSLLLK